MTREEVITLCEYVAHSCPQQRFDKYTPNVWADILAGQGYTFEECRNAVIAIKRRQPFIDTSEIIAEVKRVRRDALERSEAERHRIEERQRLEQHAIMAADVERCRLANPVPLSAEARGLLDKIRRRKPLAGPSASPPKSDDKPRYQALAELEALARQP